MFLLLLAFLPLALCAKSIAEPVTFGGFIDSYYAYDFNAPESKDRAYTTQPGRHHEPGINLAYVEAILKKDKLRGRLALQFGHSVDLNTAAEPGDHLKAIQEAWVGYALTDKTTLDGGIFLGNIGSESWISKDNWTYTRAIMLDYVPYYSAGLRLEHHFSERESFQLQVLNGWSNMSENNSSKAIGMQYKKLFTEKFHFIYNNFFGDEEVVSTKSRFRGYHDFVFQYFASEEWQFLYAFDVGHQAQQNNDGVDAWFATAFTTRRVFNTDQSLALRLEYYNDRHQSNIVTSTFKGYQVAGASLNFDQKISPKVMWRNEVRGFYSVDEIFPEGKSDLNRMNGFLVTSLSLNL